jgi:hypothetical protein
VPSATGSKTEVAGLANIAAGMVIEGIKVVMIAAIQLISAMRLMLEYIWKKRKKKEVRRREARSELMLSPRYCRMTSRLHMKRELRVSSYRLLIKQLAKYNKVNLL